MILRLTVLVSLLGGGLLQAGPAWAQGTRAGVERIVRLLGYGGGIHHFKNYLLRGEARFLQAATTRFQDAAAEIDRLRTSGDLDDGDRAAVAALDKTVRAYLAALPRSSTSRTFWTPSRQPKTGCGRTRR